MFRMQRDAEHFRSKMGKIEGSGDLGDRLVELAQAKTVATETTPATGGTSSPSSSNSPKEKDEDASKSGT